ncbi:uncharacterized protein LOC133162038 isoform X1 [Syngnathus typhle]|uniref:uncharacterized protein LOC133162038 isoform X1 n=1 Tax=Syngnathus typhle TaxID=161592 RepID=UPI002A6B877B|nr:uncharacterized protein LOC133162038 isoform X1 [Syngnathus typhle]
MATVSQMQAFQTHLTERFTSFAMEVSQEVALIVKGYQEEIDCLRSLLNKEMNLRWNIALKDHNRLAVREQPPEPNVPEETVAEPIPKRYKIEHTQVWADVQEEKPTDVLHPVAKTTKEEQTEVLVSSAVGQSEAMAAMQQTGPSEPCAFERAGILAHNVSEPLANGPHEEHIEYNRNLALKQESGMDGGTAMDCPRSDPKEQDTPGLQTTTFDFYTAKEFTQPSTSGENTKQDLLHPERPMISLKKIPECCVQKTILEFPRKRPDKSTNVTSPPPHTFLAKLNQRSKDCPEQNPPISKIEDMDITFDHVPQDHPMSLKEDFTYHDNVCEWPQLPLPHHTSTCVEREMAGNLEQTAEKKKEAGRKVQPGPYQPQPLIFTMGKKTSISSQQEEELRSQALRLYCRNVCVNWRPCDLVFDLNFPWLGARPHGLVYDPKQDPCFGLVYVSCSPLWSFAECKFLRFENEEVCLENTDEHYVLIQAQMMVTGMSWCDLLVFAKEDALVQRIFRDRDFIEKMKAKVEEYYFDRYLPQFSK